MRPAAAPGRVADWWPEWLRGWRADAVIAFVAGVIQLVGTYFAARNQTDRTSLDALAYALLAAGPVALLVRRRFPVAVLLVVFGTTLAYWTIDYPRGPVFIALIVAFITTVVAGYRAVAVVTLIVGWTAFTFLPYLVGNESRPGLAGPFALLAWLLVLFGVGEVARAGRARAAETARTREEEARARVDEERLRIAREVHDTVAHAIAIINVQSGVTAHLLDKRPERTREALEAIEKTSSQALHEMRSILGVLRDDDDRRVPHPGLGQIGDLFAEARRAGLDIMLEAASPTAALPSAVDSAAYRILQESITNVIRHVGPTRVTVGLDYAVDTLEVRVTNERGNNHGDQSPPAEPGRGITGMRERCQLLGGHLDAGPGTDGGFMVTARLPFAPAAGTHQ